NVFSPSISSRSSDTACAMVTPLEPPISGLRCRSMSLGRMVLLCLVIIAPALRMRLLPPRGFAAPLLARSQITQAVHGQPVGIFDSLVGKLLDVTRQLATQIIVERMSGHATIDVDCSGKRFCDFFD